MSETRETDPKKARYLRTLARVGTLTAGCKAARVSHNTVYQWREIDDQFLLAEREARESFADALEKEAVRRAWTGTNKPVYQGGVLVGHIREYSDTLLIFMMKAVRPAKFRENVRVEHTGADGGPIEIADPREQLNRRITQLAARTPALGSDSGVEAE